MNKKLLAVMLIVVMVLASAVTVFGQTEDVGQGDRSITISNPSKDETYDVYKLFDATVTADGSGINYTYEGTLPADLAPYFEVDDDGNVTAKKDSFTKEDAEAIAAYAVANATKVASVKSDGSKLTFTNMAPGYYVVTSTLGTTATIDSAKEANVVIYDKNTKQIEIEKEVEKTSYSIGDTVKYTATFNTVNFLGEGENAKQVVEYVISDTLPEFLGNVTVTSIKVDDVAITTQQFVNKQMTIPWATPEGDPATAYTSLYKNGATLVIEYQGVLTSVTNINADDKNEITLKPYTWTPTEGKKPWSEEWKDDAVIRTYAAALVKVDEKQQPLAGATFKLSGVTVEQVSEGVYRVTACGDGLETGELSTDADGKLYIIGLAEGTELGVDEVTAPDGYNRLTTTEKVVAQVLDETVHEASGERHYDADGNLVSQSSNETTTQTVTRNLEDLDALATKIVNQKGTEMPATGGMGTTILYTLGGLLVVGAGVLLVARRKMDN